MPGAGSKAEIYLMPLNHAMAEFDIVNAKRAAAFLAQVAHESGQLRYVRELADGEAYDTGRLAERLGNTPEDDGDGPKYRGRGLIQVTGLANMRECSIALFGDESRLVDHPEILELPEYAARSAGWFWKSRGLNELADEGRFTVITRRINGGVNGMHDRLVAWDRAQAVLA